MRDSNAVKRSTGETIHSHFFELQLSFKTCRPTAVPAFSLSRALSMELRATSSTCGTRPSLPRASASIMSCLEPLHCPIIFNPLIINRPLWMLQWVSTPTLRCRGVNGAYFIIAMPTATMVAPTPDHSIACLRFLVGDWSLRPMLEGCDSRE